MLNFILISICIAIILLIVFMSLLNRGPRMILYRVLFYFKVEYSYYLQIKKANRSKKSSPLKQKNLFVILKDDDTKTNENIISACKISKDAIFTEINNANYYLALTDKQVIVIIDNKDITKKESLKLIIFTEFLAKKLHSPFSIIENISFYKNSHLNNTIPNEENFLKTLFISSKRINCVIKWFDNVESVAGFSSFKDCTSTFPKATTSYIKLGKLNNEKDIHDYFNYYFNEISKYTFLKKSTEIDGAFVFLKTLKEHLYSEKIKTLDNKNIEEILFLDMFSLNNLSVLTFMDINKSKTSILTILMLLILSLTSVATTGYLINGYNQYRNWLSDANKEIENTSNLSEIDFLTKNNIESLKLAPLYPDQWLTKNVYNNIANKFINEVLIPQIEEQKNLYKQSLLILLISVNDRSIFASHETLIRDFLHLSKYKTALHALLNSSIQASKESVPEVSVANQDITQSNFELSYYNSYFERLINSHTNNYSDFTRFANKYIIPLRIQYLMKEALNKNNYETSLSTKNVEFINQLMAKQKRDTSINEYISPQTLNIIQQAPKASDTTIGGFIKQINILLDAYNKISLTDRESPDALFLKSAIASYINTYSVYLITNDVAPINESQQDLDKFQITLIEIGSFKLSIPIAFTKNYYNNIIGDVNQLQEINKRLNNIQLHETTFYIEKLKQYIQQSYTESYIKAYDNIITQLKSINLADVSTKNIVNNFALPHSQFYEALDTISENTTFSKSEIQDNPSLDTINKHFAEFKKVTNKDFIRSYQKIIASLHHKDDLTQSILTYINDPDKSPLIQINNLLKKNNIDSSYDNIFTQPISSIIDTLKPALFNFFINNWNKNIVPNLSDLVDLYPFNSSSNKIVTDEEISTTFGPGGDMPHIIDKNFLPFLTKKDGIYYLDSIPNDQQPKKIKNIINYINSYENLSAQLWDKNGQAKNIKLTINPLPVPTSVLNDGDDDISIAATYLNLDNAEIVNIPQQQSTQVIDYQWNKENHSANIGWIDSQGNTHSLLSETGNVALSKLLTQASETKGDTYLWDIDNNDDDIKIGFKISSPLFKFISEVKNYAKI